RAVAGGCRRRRLRGRQAQEGGRRALWMRLPALLRQEGCLFAVRPAPKRAGRWRTLGRGRTVESLTPPRPPRTHRQTSLRPADEKCHEAQSKDGVAKRSSEVLPEGRRRAGVVRRKQQGEHEEKTRGAGNANQQAENQAEADGEFAVGHQESDRGRVWQHEV